MSGTRSAAGTADRSDGPSPLTLGASLVFLTGLAVTYPVLEVLGANPEFFIARAAPTSDAVRVALLLGLAVPAAVGLSVAALTRVHRTAGIVVHGLAATAILALLLYEAASRRFGPGVLLGVAAVAAGAALTCTFWRLRSSWSVVRWGAAVPVIAVGLFVLAWPSSRVIVGTEEIGAVGTGVTSDTPVTVMVFDELSTAALLRASDEIDAERFPNLAAFADDAVWYRNATTVSDSTTLAVPAVFTGRWPDPDALPIAADHPESLFTLLGDSHEVRAVEPVTDLCPATICGAPSAEPAGPSGLTSLASDISLIGAHVLLPETATDGLPRIDRAWGDFGAAFEGGADAAEDDPAVGGGDHDLVSRMNETVARDRRDDLSGVVRPGGTRPPAHLLHTLLPHVPYRLLPSGQAVHPTPLAGVGAGEVWQDRWLARNAAARYLLQSGYVDRVVGDLVDDLRATGAYEDGLVIITADHGVSFEAGTTRRRVSGHNLPQIASVPLLVKYPDGPAGRIDRRPAQTIDVVPTVLDVLGVPPPPELDGTSLLEEEGGTGGARTIDGFDGEVTFSLEEADPWQRARTYRQVFGDGWTGVYRYGPHTDLLGKDLSELSVADDARFIGSVDRVDEIRDDEPDSDPLVGVLSGGLGYRRDPGHEQFVAVVFDGRVVAVGRTYEHEPDRAPFLALIPPEGFAGDVDEISLFTIQEDDDGTELVPVLVP